MMHWCEGCGRLYGSCPTCEASLSFVAMCYLNASRMMDVIMHLRMEDVDDPNNITKRLNKILPNGWDDEEASDGDCRIVHNKNRSPHYAHLKCIPEETCFLWHCVHCNKDVHG